MKKEEAIAFLMSYLKENYPNTIGIVLPLDNGVRWRQFNQYIDKGMERDIRLLLGDNLSEFYWESSYQYVYVK